VWGWGVGGRGWVGWGRGRGEGGADKLGGRLIMRLIVLAHEVGGALTFTSQG